MDQHTEQEQADQVFSKIMTPTALVKQAYQNFIEVDPKYLVKQIVVGSSLYKALSEYYETRNHLIAGSTEGSTLYFREIPVKPDGEGWEIRIL